MTWRAQGVRPPLDGKAGHLAANAQAVGSRHRLPSPMARAPSMNLPLGELALRVRPNSFDRNLCATLCTPCPSTMLLTVLSEPHYHRPMVKVHDCRVAFAVGSTSRHDSVDRFFQGVCLVLKRNGGAILVGSSWPRRLRTLPWIARLRSEPLPTGNANSGSYFGR